MLIRLYRRLCAENVRPSVLTRAILIPCARLPSIVEWRVERAAQNSFNARRWREFAHWVMGRHRAQSRWFRWSEIER